MCVATSKMVAIRGRTVDPPAGALHLASRASGGAAVARLERGTQPWLAGKRTSLGALTTLLLVGTIGRDGSNAVATDELVASRCRCVCHCGGPVGEHGWCRRCGPDHRAVASACGEPASLAQVHHCGRVVGRADTWRGGLGDHLPKCRRVPAVDRAATATVLHYRVCRRGASRPVPPDSGEHPLKLGPAPALNNGPSRAVSRGTGPAGLA